MAKKNNKNEKCTLNWYYYIKIFFFSFSYFLCTELASVDVTKFDF